MTPNCIDSDWAVPQVSGRVLFPPDVRYGRKVVKPRFGGWNLQNVQFVKPATLESYCVACMMPHNKYLEQDMAVRFSPFRAPLCSAGWWMLGDWQCCPRIKQSLVICWAADGQNKCAGKAMHLRWHVLLILYTRVLCLKRREPWLLVENILKGSSGLGNVCRPFSLSSLGS